MRKGSSSILAAFLTLSLLTGCGSAAQSSTAADTEAQSSSAADPEAQSTVVQDGSETREFTWPAEPAESTIYVEKIADMPEDFITGVDVSSYLSEINSGVTFYDYEGNALSPQDFFVFLHRCGINYIRLRLWVDPYDEAKNAYGGGNCDLQNVTEMGKLASDAGMQVLIDFHYSDFWADPSKQYAPKAWAGMDIDTKAQALSDYTTESLKALLDDGVNVGMVQLGNETTGGMAGESSWPKMLRLFDAGSKAVRQVAEDKGQDILIAVHFANPERAGKYKNFAYQLASKHIDYDVFASSYYPYWHGSLENLTGVLKEVADTYDKKVMVAETSYMYTWEDGDGSGNTESKETVGSDWDYAVSQQGQADVISKVTRAVLDTGAGIGIFYWEPAWIPVQVWNGEESVYKENQKIWETYGSGWASSFSGDYDADAAMYYGGSAVDNQALFDFEGHPLESLRTFEYLRRGANAPLAVTRAVVEDFLGPAGEIPALPETVSVEFNNGTAEDVPVTWKEEDLLAAAEGGAGTYTINGTYEAAGQMLDISCQAILNTKNYLADPGFEDTSTASWTITVNSGNDPVAIENDLNNVRSGNGCLKFWAEQEQDFEVTQVVHLEEGTYRLGGYLEGGDAGESPEFYIYLRQGDQIWRQDTFVTKWQVWENPEITDISVAGECDVTVGIVVKVPGKAWGAFDDFYLYRIDE
ncbi:MAG: glycosyl hydrolase 53 family protein [Lachnospiraceae bacterium]|nr:glycosyl hydrolase 53 family protein [Lachnospiraceae bacterium]